MIFLIAAGLLAGLFALLYIQGGRIARDIFEELDIMANPTIEQLLAALEALKEALAAEQAAHATSQQRAKEFLELLAEYTGGLTPKDLDEVTKRLQAHAQQLEAIRNDATKK